VGLVALSLRFVQQLDHVIEPVVSRLTDGIQDRDLFETDYIVVPNAGVRAWLLQKLAYTLGATPNNTDGVIGNVQVGFIGMLDKFIAPVNRHNDPWGVEHLTFAVLHAVDQLRDDSAVVANISRLGGGLKAARTMADRFDRYHARRPHMIRKWEDGLAELSPSIGDDARFNDVGELEAVLVPAPLKPEDQWQFTLWRKVRELIGMLSPPARSANALQQLRQGDVAHNVPSRITVVGLQSLSSRHVEVLRALALVSDVSVVMVHPSPELVNYWSGQFANRPVAPGIAIARPSVTAVPERFNTLVYSWLRGSMDLQHMLAVNGVAVAPYQVAHSKNSTHLLASVQNAVTRPSEIHKADAFTTADQSLLIHRAHNLARQVEVLHDALLHAFDQLPNLQPHEVVIVSPDIAKAAPLLQATFQREVTNSKGETFSLPLVVADRGLREVDEGSRLLADLLSLLRSRFGISDVLPVITSPLVLKRFRLSADDVDTWKRYIEQARVRWGLDDTHRLNAWKVNLGTEGLAHTWALAIRRSLLGATLPDSPTPHIELGGVVPMIDVEPNEMRAITALAEIMSILAVAQNQIASNGNVDDWCNLVEECLTKLAFNDRGELDQALEAVNHFVVHSHVPMSNGELHVDVDVDFAHIAGLITEQLTAAPGRQPLRTGAITATSTIPLRSVPFRVVCIVGMDDGVLSAGDAEGDDLESRQQLIGDSDARLEQRRTLLDAIVAAQDRVIITCVGRSIKNNVLSPMVTPLAELVELCQALGVGDHGEHKDLSKMEVLHPRHFNSAINFVKGQLIKDLVWSHSSAARDAAASSYVSVGAQPVVPLQLEPAQIVSLDSVVNLVRDPLRVFVHETLGISTWRDNREDEPALIPLDIGNADYQALAASLFAGLASGGTEEEWEEAAVVSGLLPPGQYRVSAIDEIKAFVAEMRQKLTLLPYASVDDLDVSLALPSGRVLTGRIPGVCTRADGSKFILRTDFGKKKETFTQVLPIHLIVLCALGHEVESAYFLMQHDKEPEKCSARFVISDSPLVQEQCVERLNEMLNSLEVARSMPCPSFDGAASMAKSDRDAAADKFQQFVSNGRSYKYKLENLIYGFSPFFDDVLPDDSPIISFWDVLSQAAPQLGKGANAGGGFSRFKFS